MPFKEGGPQNDYLIPNITGIGGVTCVANDLFKISIEEAVEFMKVFRVSVDEKLNVLSEIEKCKKTPHSKYNQDYQMLQQDEIKARFVFEMLQQQLQSWLFKNGGISLTKNKV